MPIGSSNNLFKKYKLNSFPIIVAVWSAFNISFVILSEEAMRLSNIWKSCFCKDSVPVNDERSIYSLILAIKPIFPLVISYNSCIILSLDRFIVFASSEKDL